MDFEFSTARPTPVAMEPPKEPPDRGGSDVRNEQVPIPVSFRDKVHGKQAAAPREKVDLLANKVIQMELLNGSRPMPMFHVDKSLIEELSIPWKDALVAKLLGKTLGYSIRRKF